MTMSEFLKNFRTTHSRFSGNKRNPYDGHYYPAQDRRNGNDRRNEQSQTQGKTSSSFYLKIEEFIPTLQALLETITENQQILIELKKEKTRREDAMASAFKDIAETLDILRGASPSGGRPAPAEIRASGLETASSLTVEELEKTEMKSSADEKRDIIRIMKKLRKKGGTYKEIAHFLNENNVPTFSNKGHWHAQTIHRLCSR
jgi:hypothetical protein